MLSYTCIFENRRLISWYIWKIKISSLIIDARWYAGLQLSILYIENKVQAYAPDMAFYHYSILIDPSVAPWFRSLSKVKLKPYDCWHSLTICLSFMSVIWPWLNSRFVPRLDCEGGEATRKIWRYIVFYKLQCFNSNKFKEIYKSYNFSSFKLFLLCFILFQIGGGGNSGTPPPPPTPLFIPSRLRNFLSV